MVLLIIGLMIKKSRKPDWICHQFTKNIFILFDQLPYSAHLENPTIPDVVNNKINDKETLQKHLLATGVLESSIQDSLNMIVVDDGKLSNMAACRELDLKMPNVMKKPNPVVYIFKDIAKFNKMQ